MNIPTIRSYDKINIMADMELTDIRIDDVQPASIIKCRSRDKINDMVQLDKSPKNSLGINAIEKSKKTLIFLTNPNLASIDEVIAEPVDNPRFAGLANVASYAGVDYNEKQYIQSIQFYLLYLVYGFLGGVIFNSTMSKDRIVTFDMIFNCMISPILYYHSPKHILMKIDRNVLLFCYTPFYLLGLCFRFLDGIPEINTFTLDLITIDSITKIILSTCVLIGILAMCSYYIYKSRFPKINGILFVLYLSFIIVSFYLFYHNGGRIYFHHYFIGLLVMIISRNYHSNIVVVIHAFAYGVYIDGISRWGFASIYH
jgi:hypothetical protein